MAATSSLPPPLAASATTTTSSSSSSGSSSTIATTSSLPPSSSSSTSSTLISRKKTSPIPCNYGDLLNHEKYSKLCDMIFVAEGKNIYTVRAVIQKRLPHLAKAPPTVVNRSKTAKDLSLTTLELKDSVPYDAMMALFEYAYTGTVALDKMSMRQVMALLGVANKVGVDAVVNLCERRLKQQLSLEVVFALMKLAHDLDMVSIKAVCMDYCMLNYAQVVGRKDGIATIGIDLFQEMTMEHMKQREVPPIVPNELSPDTLAADFTAIFQEMAHADAFMQFDARKIMFHRAIVATGSDRLLAAMIQQASGGSSKKPAQVQLPVLTEGAFSGLLQLIYSGFSSLTPVAACSLITHSVIPLELPAVQTFCEAVVHDISLVNALTVLELTYLPVYKSRGDITVTLREKALSFVVANFPQISVLHIEHMPPHICLDILRAIHAHQKLYGVSAADQDVSFNRSTPNLKALVTPRDADDERRRKKSSSSSSSSRKKRDTVDDSGMKDGVRSEKKHRSKDLKERSTVTSSSSSSSIATPPPTSPTTTSTPSTPSPSQ